MNYILSIVGLIVGILGVVVTVTIFCIQNYQSANERKIQELLKLQDELLRCKNGCDELGSYNWYSDMKFSETRRELDHAIDELNSKIRLFKNEKYIYIQRYDNEVIHCINNYIQVLEIEIRKLHEDAELQDAYIEHHFHFGKNSEENWELYEHACTVIKNTLGVFRAFSIRVQEDNEYVQDILDKKKYQRNILQLQFEAFDEEVLKREINKSKKEKF